MIKEEYLAYFNLNVYICAKNMFHIVKHKENDKRRCSKKG